MRPNITPSYCRIAGGRDEAGTHERDLPRQASGRSHRRLVLGGTLIRRSRERGAAAATISGVLK
jgi:hypothetical protein